MRWVWRAERGVSALEYAGLVVIAAALVTALVAFGMPGMVKTKVSEAMCVVMGEDGCKVEAGGPQDEEGSSGRPDSGHGRQSASPSPTGNGDEEGDNVAYDPEKAREYERAKKELAKANKAKANTGDAWGELRKELEGILGIEDIKKCVAEGDIISCAKSVVGFTAVGKLAKIAARSGKILKAFNRVKKLRKLKKARSARLAKARERYAKAKKACKSGRKKNSFVAGTPVLLADGRTVDIEDVDLGDEVLATDPDTGSTSPQPVTDTITGSGPKDLVTLTVLADEQSGPLTATAEHPFWDADDETWVDAAALTPGDTLATADGETATVASTIRSTQRQTVHNLTVEGLHTYYVGAKGMSLLTHNADGVEDTACDIPDFNWSPKSVKTWGHTFNRHGAGKQNTEKLKGRAASTGKDQGQWQNDDEAAKFLKKNYNPKSDGPQEVELSKGMGQVVKPNGDIVEATHVRVVMKPDGTFRTAIPIVK